MKNAPAPVLFRVALEIAGLDAAAGFYEKLLAMEGRRVGGGRLYFDCGQIILALVDVAAGGKKPAPISQNVYFAVPDVEAVHSRADALGCLSTEKIHGASGGDLVKRPWGERSFYVQDPFGNKLCFVDGTTLFRGR